MQALFTLATERLRVTWSSVAARPTAVRRTADQVGRLAVRLLRPGARLISGSWGSADGHVQFDSRSAIGPLLYEQVDYRVAVRADGFDVRLEHRDPLIVNRFDDDEVGRLDGLVNFGSQIGISTFRVILNGVPELEFDVEVFPSKLDYKTDYDEILASVQDTLSGLALEYLRATWQNAERVTTPAPTQLEWLTLLRATVEDLDRALRRVASHPVRSLARTEVQRRPDQVRRVDSNVRNHLRRATSASLGAHSPWPGATRIPERSPIPSLDTSEHRWLALQVHRIRARLAQLLQTQRASNHVRPTARGMRVEEELSALEAHTVRWSRLDPLAAAEGPPPAGFISLQLLSAPGYREAYRACMTLTLGLRLEGGPVSLSVKDLAVLYEYWCYLALLQILAEETGANLTPERLVQLRGDGLSFALKRGQESRVSFPLPDQRTLTVRYNPSFGADALVPQRPDILLTMEHPDWPAAHLVLDAKYRVDSSGEYVDRYGTPGPPEDALNAMHRYRDAILDSQGDVAQRTVVQAAALFPQRVGPAEYEQGRLWRALDRIGVGAVPFLPGHEGYMRTWLRRWLDHGSWNTADQALDHAAIARASAWRQAAAEPVLVGALRGEDPEGHLRWIRDHQRYYTPMSREQPRLFAVRAVVFYEPARAVGKLARGAVRFHAQVTHIRVVKRDEIATPWPARRASEDQVLYELGPLLPLQHAIINQDQAGRGQRVGARRWSSRLALGRARTLEELFLESEPEWRLYEELRAARVPFTLRTVAPALRTADELRGRVHFLMGDGSTVGWHGAAGFVVGDGLGNDQQLAQVDAVVARLRGKG